MESRVTSLNTLEVSLVWGAVQLSVDISCCSGSWGWVSTSDSSVLIKVDITGHWRRSYQKPCFLEATRTCLPAQPSQGIKMMEYRQESTNREFLTTIHWYIWLRRHLFPDNIFYHIFIITEPIQKQMEHVKLFFLYFSSNFRPFFFDAIIAEKNK